jgi:shikimate kinase
MNIILTGFMGSGKSSVGKLLAKELDDKSGKSSVGQLLSEKLNYKFVDLDELIVKHEGKSINDIFAEKGEKYFRDIETKIVKEISLEDKQVVATGGGVVLREENMDALEKSGQIIYLHVSPEVVYERLKDDDSRPLLKVKDPLQKIKELLDKREPYYKRNNFMIDTSNMTVEEVVQEIVKEIINLTIRYKARL